LPFENEKRLKNNDHAACAGIGDRWTIDYDGDTINNIIVNGGFKGAGAAVPLLTGCILKQVKILHENASFLPKFFFNFGNRAYSPLQTPPATLLPFISNFCIRR